MKLGYPMVLKDALCNCSERVVRNTDDERYGRGVLVGAVSAIMALANVSWAEAFELVKEQLPSDMVEGCYPEGWK